MDIQMFLQKKIVECMDDEIKMRNNMYHYYKLFGFDCFLEDYYCYIADCEPYVLLACLNCEKSFIDQFIREQTYHNIIVIPFHDVNDFLKKWKEIENTKAEYLAFLEMDHQYKPNRLSDSVLSLSLSPDDMVISYRNFLTDSNYELKDDSINYTGVLKNKSFLGEQLLSICIELNKNLYGNLSTILVRKSVIKQIIDEEKTPLNLSDGNDNSSLMINLMKKCSAHFLNNAHVFKKLKPQEPNIISAEMGNFKGNVRIPEKIKEITFFYTDKSEYYNLLPIAEKAEGRGYKTVFTEDIYQKAEIGIYCQHVCYPENSRFSVILLHDMAQGHNRWPNIWRLEPWDKFDLAILPGKEWADRWAECASVSYARPRYGVYVLGYPKGDCLLSHDIVDKANALRKNMKYSFTVLYATSWENDNKEDDFIQAAHTLPVNMIVKQAPVQNSTGSMFQLHRESVAAMRKLHEGKYENLTYIDVTENIFIALDLCDLVISDESSVMLEAALYGKPSIAITDWLIPDTIPHRYASVPMSSVYKCTKDELHDAIKRMMEDTCFYEECRNLGRDFFANQGHCCDDILDLIEKTAKGIDIGERLKKMKVIPKYEIISMNN